jgi:8-oxo-dGTP diphosphatase
MASAVSAPQPASVAVIVWGGRVLVIKRKIPDGSLVWQFPGGKIEKGESPEQAAVREAREEVGLVVEPLKSLGERHHPATGRHIHYIACTVRGVQVRIDRREVEDFGWFDVKGLVEHTPEGVYAPVMLYLDGVLT